MHKTATQLEREDEVYVIVVGPKSVEQFYICQNWDDANSLTETLASVLDGAFAVVQQGRDSAYFLEQGES